MILVVNANPAPPWLIKPGRGKVAELLGVDPYGPRARADAVAGAAVFVAGAASHIFTPGEARLWCDISP